MVFPSAGASFLKVFKRRVRCHLFVWVVCVVRRSPNGCLSDSRISSWLKTTGTVPNLRKLHCLETSFLFESVNKGLELIRSLCAKYADTYQCVLQLWRPIILLALSCFVLFLRSDLLTVFTKCGSLKGQFTQ